MGSLRSEEQKLAKYLLKKLGLSWEGYLQRFESTVPLQLRMTDLYSFRLSPEEVEREIDLIENLSSAYDLKRFDKEYKIVCGFKRKVRKEEVEILDYIHVNCLGLDMVFHQRVIDIMLKICPDDFQPIPVTLISSNKHIEPFEIKSFYAINVLKCVYALDNERSEIVLEEIQPSSWLKPSTTSCDIFYKNDPWQDGCTVYSENKRTQLKFYTLEKPCMLAIDASSSRIIWHPKLAKEMPYSSLYSFMLDGEMLWLYYNRGESAPKLYEEIARLD